MPALPHHQANAKMTPPQSAAHLRVIHPPADGCASECGSTEQAPLATANSLSEQGANSGEENRSLRAADSTQQLCDQSSSTQKSSPQSSGVTIHDQAEQSPQEPAGLQPTPELLAELAAASSDLEDASPDEIIRWATERFGMKLTMGTAFGPEGMTIIHRLASIAPKTPIFNLDTGYQFQETIDLAARIHERYGIEIEFKRPELSVEQYETLHGGPVYKSDPSRCCADRKLAVLHRSIIGKHAWISAIRRDQSPDRAKASIVGWDKKFGLVKINPLANSSKNDIWKLITEENIPYNPLHDQGYTSIGCAPCTRAVLFGEDERAGRWSGAAKTECGLHSLDEQEAPTAPKTDL